MTYTQFKSEFESLISDLLLEKDEETISNFDFYKSLKFAETIIAQHIGSAEYEAKQSLEKLYNKQELKNIGVEIREGRKMYNFKGVTYTPYIDAKKNEELAKESVKAIENILIANISLNEKMALHNSDGELLPVPELSYSKPSVIIKQF